MTEKTAKEKMAENGKTDAEGASAATASPGKDAEKEKPSAGGIKISMFRVGFKYSMSLICHVQY